VRKDHNGQWPCSFDFLLKVSFEEFVSLFNRSSTFRQAGIANFIRWHCRIGQQNQLQGFKLNSAFFFKRAYISQSSSFWF